MYTLRQAGPDDVGAIQALERSLAAAPHSTELLLEAIAEAKVVLAEAEEQGVVGYVRWEHFWDCIPLCLTVLVKPEHRRRGVGRRLYQHIEAAFRQRGCTFWLSSTEETNQVSQRFHESLGFRRIGALAELGQDVPEVFYRKDLR